MSEGRTSSSSRASRDLKSNAARKHSLLGGAWRAAYPSTGKLCLKNINLLNRVFSFNPVLILFLIGLMLGCSHWRGADTTVNFIPVRIRLMLGCWSSSPVSVSGVILLHTMGFYVKRLNNVRLTQMAHVQSWRTDVPASLARLTGSMLDQLRGSHCWTPGPLIRRSCYMFQK